MNQKLKKVLNLAIVLLISVIFIRCQQDESPTSNQTEDVLSAQKWFNKNVTAKDFALLNYVKDINWNTAIVSDGDQGAVIEIPIYLKDNLTTSNKKDNYDFHRIMITKSKEGTYKASYIQIITPDASFDNLDAKFNYYAIDNFNGNIYVKDILSDANTQLKFEKGKKIIKNLTAKEDAVAEQECIYFGWWNEDGSFDPISLVGCYGSGGADGPSSGGSYGGGGSGGSAGSTNTEVNTPPSCESFNFTSKPGTIWQESAVKNIYMRIVLLDDHGYEILHVVSFPQPVLFGAPTNVKIGNTNITPGLAANAAALALQTVMDDVKNRFKLTNTSDMIVEQYFRERLLEEIPFRIPGGRVQFNSTTTLPATEYQTTLVFSSDCR